MRRLSPREIKRMMSRLGVNATEMPDVEEVILKTATKEVVIRNPSVTSLEVSGQQVFQVIGERVEERETSKKTIPPVETKIPDEDVLLVAQQVNVSFEEAKAALEKVEGDLAQAILLLTSKKI